MSKVKYQHYVPRFYLEGFQNGAKKLWCYDKHLDKSYAQSPERLGGERYFYDIPELEKQAGAAQFVEKWFHPLEQKAAQILKEWRFKLARSVFSPSADDLEPMALFLIMQYLRTPRARRELVAVHELAAKVKFYNFLGEKDPELARQIKNPIEELGMRLREEKWASAHACSLIDVELIEEMAAVLLEHIWVVTENKTEWSLYTSDHPFVRRATIRHPFRSMTGLQSRGIHIVYPLSPTHTLNLMGKDGLGSATAVSPKNLSCAGGKRKRRVSQLASSFAIEAVHLLPRR